MSGNSGPSRGGDPAKKAGLAKGKNPADRCDLDFAVDLSAVNLPIVRTLATGAVLAVDLAPIGNLEAVVCKQTGGDVVGTLAAFEGLADLIDCMRRGNSYSATVVRINGATCTVHVRRTSK
jgi:invasion protein IalB